MTPQMDRGRNSDARHRVPGEQEGLRLRLDEMVLQASEDGLYDVKADAYCEALAKARKTLDGA